LTILLFPSRACADQPPLSTRLRLDAMAATARKVRASVSAGVGAGPRAAAFARSRVHARALSAVTKPAAVVAEAVVAATHVAAAHGRLVATAAADPTHGHARARTLRPPTTVNCY
jgi:hypothetical protein